MSEGKKQYEISYLARTEADKDAVLKVLREIAAVNLQEGRITEIKLAYPVKKQTSAFFGEVMFEALPETITKINVSLKFSEGILRFLIVTPLAKKLHPYFGGKNKAIAELSPAGEVHTEGVEISPMEEVAKLEEREPSACFGARHSLISREGEKVDDVAFDEKLEEILTNVQAK